MIGDLDQLSLAQVINLHLNLTVVETSIDGRKVKVISTFTELLKDTRRNTGRNEKTGEIEIECRSTEWLGNLGYFILLDQIGSLYKPIETLYLNRDISKAQKKEKGDPPKKKLMPTELKKLPGLKWALYHFGRDEFYCSHKLNALYAVRNMLAHNFSIELKGKENHLYRFFTVNHGEVFSVEYTNNTQTESKVTLNFRLFGDMVEKLVNEVQILATEHKLKLNEIPEDNSEFIINARSGLVNELKLKRHIRLKYITCVF